MNETRRFLKKLNLPGGDAYNLPSSKNRFTDGGQYRFEVPGIQGPATMNALLEELNIIMFLFIALLKLEE